MASKGNDPYERRTRSIYDALDSRNWKVSNLGRCMHRIFAA